jgi:hypothetical protein
LGLYFQRRFFFKVSANQQQDCFCLIESKQDIFRRIFLRNCWWQKSDIWSQASYRYPILWVAFLDPSDSYFLFADLVGCYTHWTYKVDKQEVGIRWVQKRFPQYGVPIWSLWPNIRFLPSLVSEKNVTKNVHICLMCINIFLSNYWWQKSDIWSQASYRYPILREAFLNPSDSYFLFVDFVDFYTHWTYMQMRRQMSIYVQCV